MPIRISKYINADNFKKEFQEFIRELNINNDLIKFKIKFKEPVEMNYGRIKDIKGVTCRFKKGTEKVNSIYQTSSFKFGYYSEYLENPFSKFLLSLGINWEEVDNIEFKKAVGLKDILQIDPFYWIMEFPNVFFRRKEFKGFDIIIGNPPFVRADTEDEWFLLQRNLLAQITSYEKLYEKWDIFVAFIENSIKHLLKENGYFGFVVSDAICTAKYPEKIRDWLQGNYKIPLIDYFEGFEVFKGIGINPILLFVKKSNQISKTGKIIHSGSFNNISKSYKIDQNFEYFWKKNIPEILSFEIGKYEKLGDICYISVGMVPNADEKTAKGEFKKDDLISNEYSKIHNKLYVESKHTGRYKIKEIKYFEWGTERSPSKLRRPTFPELYKGKKILRGRLTEGVIDVIDLIDDATLYNLRIYIDLKVVDNRSIKDSIRDNNREIIENLCIKKKYLEEIEFDVLEDLKKQYNNKEYKEISEELYTEARKTLEELSRDYTYEYLLAVLNSKYGMSYLNAIKTCNMENYVYPNELREFPIKKVNDQQPFINIVKILQFLYQINGKKEVIEFFDNNLLNFVIYEIYFEDKLKTEGLYQDLLNYVEAYFKKIDFETWIKLKLKHDLKDNEKNQMITIESSNTQIIEEIYNNLDKEVINQKIELMRELDWIKKIEEN